jgi:hypothetical protein
LRGCDEGDILGLVLSFAGIPICYFRGQWESLLYAIQLAVFKTCTENVEVSGFNLEEFICA